MMAAICGNRWAKARENVIAVRTSGLEVGLNDPIDCSSAVPVFLRRQGVFMVFHRRQANCWLLGFGFVLVAG